MSESVSDGKIMTLEDWPSGFPDLVALETLKSKNTNARQSGKHLGFLMGHYFKQLEANMLTKVDLSYRHLYMDCGPSFLIHFLFCLVVTITNIIGLSQSLIRTPSLG